jgi:hypothetical protein
LIYKFGTSVVAIMSSLSGVVSVVGEPPPSSIHLTPGTSTGSMTATASVYRRSEGQYAPELLILEGSCTNSGVTEGVNTYDPQAGDIIWEWQASRDGDPAWGLSGYTATVNLPTEFNTRGRFRGKRTVLAINLPGTYSIIVTPIVVATGERATSATLTVTVLDPDAVFTAAQTYLVSTSSTWDGPSHNVGNRYARLDQAFPAAASAGHTRFRILARRGETHNGLGMNSTATQDILFADYGSGAKPVMNTRTNVSSNGGTGRKTITFHNFAPQGTLNTANNTGSAPEPMFFVTAETSAAQYHLLFNDCDFLNFNEAIVCVGNNGLATDSFAAAVNCSFDNRWNSSMFGVTGAGFAMVGCRSVARPDGLQMLTSGDPGGFAYRTSNSRWLEYIAQCDWFNIHGNFQSFGNTANTQSNIRMQTNHHTATTGTHFVLDRCSLESGFVSMSRITDIQESTGTRRPCNYIVDSVIFIKGHDLFAAFMSFGNSGVWVRNVIGVVTPNRVSTVNLSSPGSYRGASLINMAFVSGAADGANNHPVKAYSNTLINLSDVNTPTQIGFIDSGFSSNWQPSNNLTFSPYVSSGNYTGAFLSESLFATRYQGFRTYNSTTTQPATRTATHFVDLTSVTGTFNEGTTSGEVSLTAPGTVTAKIAQVFNTGGSTRRLWLYDVTGTIANGATVTVSGGSGTASGAMQAANFARWWIPTGDPGVDSGQPFARVGIRGDLQTSAFRGALPQAT